MHGTMHRAARAAPLSFAGLLLAALAACTGDRPAADRRTDDRQADDLPAPDSMPRSGAGSPVSRVPQHDSAAPGHAPDSANAPEWTVHDTRVRVTPAGVATLQSVRTAAHPDFDRIVFEFAGPELPSYQIAYVDRPVTACGSGEVVPLAGDAWLGIQLQPSQAHTEQGAPTIAERNRAPRLPNLLELKLICDFEAVVEWAAAVRSPQPYRVSTLRSPARLVVDIRHTR